VYVHNYRWNIGVTSQELSVIRKCLLNEDLDTKEETVALRLAKIIGGVYAAKRAERQGRDGYEGEDGIPAVENEHQHSVAGADRRRPAAVRS